MSNTKPLRILFGISSVGLGHVRRSLSIANSIRSIETDGPSSIEWACAEPASTYLKSVGEKVIDLPDLRSLSSAMGEHAVDGKIDDMSVVARRSSRIAQKNYWQIAPYLKQYDILVQDEFVETMFSPLWAKQKDALPARLVTITDYVKLESQSINPVKRLVIWYANRILKRALLNSQLRFFVDEIDSIPEGIRQWTKANFAIVGPIVADVPSKSKAEIRDDLLPEFREEKIIVFSVGGTSIGRRLCEFIVSNCDNLSERLNAKLVLLAGPRISIPNSKVRSIPFTPNSLSYFKASDCVVTQAGGSTLNEVATLGVPCVMMPIKNHWEQQRNSQRFSRRFGFKTVQYSELGVQKLADTIQAAIDSKPYEPLKPAKPESVARAIIKLARLG